MKISILKIAECSGLSRETVRARLRAAGLSVGHGGEFGVSDVIRAFARSETTELEKAKAELIRSKLAVMKRAEAVAGDVIARGEILKAIDEAFDTNWALWQGGIDHLAHLCATVGKNPNYDEAAAEIRRLLSSHSEQSRNLLDQVKAGILNSIRVE